MNLLLIALVAVAGAALLFLRWRKPGGVPSASAAAPRPAGGRPGAPAGRAPAGQPAAGAPADASAGAPAGASAAVPVPAPAAAVAPPAALPEALSGWTWVTVDALPAARREALTASLRTIPRPPNALHQLVSPQFIDRAGSAELNELIGAEAQLAAKVLASVNSPLYGLTRPVASIGQAVTFLGLNTVRSLCVQFLLDASFQPGQPALRAAYAQIWNASALASELCGKLALKLSLPEPGALVTQVLLSFLGHLATASMLSRLPGVPLTGTDLLVRVRTAQDRLGIGPAEIGALLLAEWGLPAAIVDEVRATDRLLVTPPGALPAERAQRLALAYLCARLGERLAAGALARLADADPLADPHPDFHHLRQHLADPALARLPEHLHAADLAQAVQTLQAGLRARG